MEHSLKDYLERLSAKKLEEFLQTCVKNGKEKQYGYILPLVQEMLLKKTEK